MSLDGIHEWRVINTGTVMNQFEQGGIWQHIAHHNHRKNGRVANNTIGVPE